MIAVDTNLLVYAHREDSPFHDTASRLLAGLAEGRASWAIPWPCVHEFLAIVTHPRIYTPPTPFARALDQVAAWLESPSLALLSESARYFDELSACVASGRVGGPMVHDARVYALCRLHQVSELWTADRDFGRFKGMKVVNPLLK
ncbi:MAG: PIN domain-containing protein [Myxococcales bacterium]|nr:PIN domain-containing protein [Myxococcales bacterium]